MKQTAPERLDIAPPVLATGDGRISPEPAMEPPPKPRHRRPPRPALFVLMLLVAAAAWWFWTERLVPPIAGISASGSIEAQEVSVASEVSGRVVEILANEGDRVESGQLLVRLDSTLLQLQSRMAGVAERQLLELQIEKTSVRSPLSGIVSRSSIHVGEVATAGATLMAVVELAEVELKIYVPEAQIGRVKLGQEVSVSVDSFPGQSFSGRVSYISPRAEFTPRNVQTQKDRLNLVFAVKVLIPNPDQRLKPGMPADAAIRTD